MAQVTIKTRKVQKLYCIRGKHAWERESTRGKLPKNCPEHKPILSPEHKAKMQEGKIRKRNNEREQRIQELITGKICRCGIEPTMTDTEIRSRYPGCCSPSYVCPTLDGVMRNVYADV